MVFTVEYRALDGAIRVERIEAVNRAECVAACRARRIVPIRVKRQGGDTTDAPPLKEVNAGITRSMLRLSFAFSFLLILVAICCMCLFSRGDKPEPETKSSQSASIQDRHIAFSNHIQMPRTNDTTVKGQCVTVEQEASTLLTEELQQELATEQVEEGLVISEVPTNQSNFSRKTLHTLTETYLSMLGKPGSNAPPLPMSPDADLEMDFESAATNIIKIWEDDSDQMVAHKEMVHELKKYLADARARGWTVADFIRAVEKERREQARYQQEADCILEEIRNTEPENMRAYRERLNLELKEVGIGPISKDDIEDLVEQNNPQIEAAPPIP